MHEEINKAIEVLRNGGIILYPTDTIWGIGCDATNEKAVEKIFQIKQRNDSKSLIILIDTINKLSRYVKEIPEIADELIECAENPLTIIYPEGINLAKNVLADDKSVGIRIVKHPFCEALIRKFGKPIVSTSANISGELAPKEFHQIPESILSKVDFVVNLQDRTLSSGKESSIIKLKTNGEFKIIR